MHTDDQSLLEITFELSLIFTEGTRREKKHELVRALCSPGPDYTQLNPFIVPLACCNKICIVFRPLVQRTRVRRINTWLTTTYRETILTTRTQLHRNVQSSRRSVNMFSSPVSDIKNYQLVFHLHTKLMFIISSKIQN